MTKLHEHKIRQYSKKKHLIRLFIGLGAALAGIGAGVITAAFVMPARNLMTNVLLSSVERLPLANNDDGATHQIVLTAKYSLANITADEITIINIDKNNEMIEILDVTPSADDPFKTVITILSDNVSGNEAPWTHNDRAAIRISSPTKNIFSNEALFKLSAGNYTDVELLNIESFVDADDWINNGEIVLTFSKEIENLQPKDIIINVLPNTETQLFKAKKTSSDSKVSVTHVEQNPNIKNQYTVSVVGKYDNNQEIEVSIKKDNYFVPKKNNVCNLKFNLKVVAKVKMEILGKKVGNEYINNFLTRQLNNPNLTSDPVRLGDIEYNSQNTELFVELKAIESTTTTTDGDIIENYKPTTEWKLRTGGDESSWTSQFVLIEDVPNENGKYKIKIDRTKMTEQFLNNFEIFLEAYNVTDNTQYVTVDGLFFTPKVNNKILDRSWLDIIYDNRGNGLLKGIKLDAMQKELSEDELFSEHGTNFTFDTLLIPSTVTKIEWMYEDIEENYEATKKGNWDFLFKYDKDGNAGIIKNLDFVTRTFLAKPKTLDIGHRAFDGCYSLDTLASVVKTDATSGIVTTTFNINNAKVKSIGYRAFCDTRFEKIEISCDTLENIDDYAFGISRSDVTNERKNSITIRDCPNLTKIGNNVFGWYHTPQGVDHEDNYSWIVVDGVNTRIENNNNIRIDNVTISKLPKIHNLSHDFLYVNYQDEYIEDERFPIKQYWDYINSSYVDVYRGRVYQMKENTSNLHGVHYLEDVECYATPKNYLDNNIKNIKNINRFKTISNLEISNLHGLTSISDNFISSNFAYYDNVTLNELPLLENLNETSFAQKLYDGYHKNDSDIFIHEKESEFTSDSKPENAVWVNFTADDVSEGDEYLKEHGCKATVDGIDKYIKINVKGESDDDPPRDIIKELEGEPINIWRGNHTDYFYCEDADFTKNNNFKVQLQDKQTNSGDLLKATFSGKWITDIEKFIKDNGPITDLKTNGVDKNLTPGKLGEDETGVKFFGFKSEYDREKGGWKVDDSADNYYFDSKGEYGIDPKKSIIAKITAMNISNCPNLKDKINWCSNITYSGGNT